MRIVRGVMVSVAVLVSCIVAGACGSSAPSFDAVGGTGITYVPDSALAYFMVDTRFDGDAWKQLNSGGERVPAWKDARSVLLDVAGAGIYRYARNFAPWIGKNAGFALLTKSGTKPADAIFYFESRDDAAAIRLLRTSMTTRVDSLKGRSVYRNGFGNYMLADKGVVLVGSSRRALVKALAAHDTSSNMASVASVNRAAAAVHDGAVATLVLSKHGYRLLHGSESDHNMLRQSFLDSAARFAGTQGFAVIQSFLGQVASPAATGADFQSALSRLQSVMKLSSAGQHQHVTAMAVGIAPSPAGVHVNVASTRRPSSRTDRTKLGTHYAPRLTNAVPANVVAMYDNTNLGTVIAPLASLAGVNNVDDVDRLNGEFALAVGRGAPRDTWMLAFANSAGTSDAVRGLIDQVPAMGGTLSQPDAQGLQDVTLRRQRLVVGTADDISLVAASRQAARALAAKPTLSSDPDFTALIDDAGMPKRVGGMFYLDTQRAIALTGMYSRADLAGIGPILGWFTDSKTLQRQDIFISFASSAA